MVIGGGGMGTKVFERDDAFRLVEELNREYPQIHHEAVSTDGRRESEDDKSDVSLRVLQPAD